MCPLLVNYNYESWYINNYCNDPFLTFCDTLYHNYHEKNIIYGLVLKL